MASGSKLDRELDALYAGPAEEFTEARNELAKRIREAGDSEGAERVKKLRKPTSAAGLVNRLALERRKELRGFFALTERLRKATGSAGREKMRSLVREEGELLDELIGAASEPGGVTSATLDRVRETLQAAQVDPEVREAVSTGRLEREQRAASMGLTGLTLMPASGAKPKAAETKPSGASKRRIAKARDDMAHAQAEAKQAKADAGVAIEAVARAERQVEQEMRARDSANRKLERAERKLERAQDRLADLDRAPDSSSD